MNENQNPLPVAPESQSVAEEKQSYASKSPPVASKSPTIAEIVKRASVELDGIGLTESLLREVEIQCEKAMDGIAASSLYAVVSKHISQLVPPKPARKPRNSISGTQAVSS